MLGRQEWKWHQPLWRPGNGVHSISSFIYEMNPLLVFLLSLGSKEADRADQSLTTAGHWMDPQSTQSDRISARLPGPDSEERLESSFRIHSLVVLLWESNHRNSILQACTGRTSGPDGEFRHRENFALRKSGSCRDTVQVVSEALPVPGHGLKTPGHQSLRPITQLPPLW